MNRRAMIIILATAFVPAFFFPSCVNEPPIKSVDELYPEGVVKLDSTNFTDSLKIPGRIAMVDFFSPYCDSCKKFDDTIKVIARLYKDKALIGKVNIYNNKNDSLCRAFFDCIDVYPNLLFFNSGKLARCRHGVMKVTAVAAILDSLIASVSY
jgi:thioredoxin-like negative regulator of GroEL